MGVSKNQGPLIYPFVPKSIAPPSRGTPKKGPPFCEPRVSSRADSAMLSGKIWRKVYRTLRLVQLGSFPLTVTVVKGVY